ncbi:MAG: hypothetical protein KBD44_00740 [Candidatus Pacebacteria bacterium]|jgi:hypothetical protein|nr:hypothetical protein [Candidatus Paceibacterota bacterium]
MSKGTIIFFFGIALMLIPSLGIPLEWKQYILSGMGVLLLLIGYIVRRADYFHTLESEDGVRTDETFVETTAPLFSEKVQ